MISTVQQSQYSQVHYSTVQYRKVSARSIRWTQEGSSKLEIIRKESGHYQYSRVCTVKFTIVQYSSVKYSTVSARSIRWIQEGSSKLGIQKRSVCITSTVWYRQNSTVQYSGRSIRSMRFLQQSRVHFSAVWYSKRVTGPTVSYILYSLVPVRSGGQVEGIRNKFSFIVYMTPYLVLVKQQVSECLSQ